MINALNVVGIILKNAVLLLHCLLYWWEVFLCLSILHYLSLWLVLSLLHHYCLLVLIIYRFSQTVKTILRFLLIRYAFLLINLLAGIALMRFINVIGIWNDNICSAFIVDRTYWTRSSLSQTWHLFDYRILSNIRYRLLATGQILKHICSSVDICITFITLYRLCLFLRCTSYLYYIH